MRQAFETIVHLAGEGKATCRAIGPGLLGYRYYYEYDRQCDLYVYDEALQRVVFETVTDTSDAMHWFARRAFEARADLKITIKSGTAHVKDCGQKLAVMLLSDGDNLIDQEIIPRTHLYDWLDGRQDW